VSGRARAAIAGVLADAPADVRAKLEACDGVLATMAGLPDASNTMAFGYVDIAKLMRAR
jgi:hypothetical protein